MHQLIERLCMFICISCRTGRMQLRFGGTLSIMILAYAILLSALVLLRALEFLNLLTFGIWLALASDSARRLQKKVKDRS